MFPLFIGEMLARFVSETVFGALLEGVYEFMFGKRKRRQKNGELEIDWDAIDAAEEDGDRTSD